VAAPAPRRPLALGPATSSGDRAIPRPRTWLSCPASGYDWPLALCPGGYERGPPDMTITGMQPLTGNHLAGKALGGYARWRREPKVKEEK
jgi:hypothetical protein